MNSIEQLQCALELAKSLGYGIRHEWLGGAMGGACEVAGRKWLFVDISLNLVEQLDQVAEALRADPAIHTVESIPVALQPLLSQRRAA